MFLQSVLEVHTYSHFCNEIPHTYPYELRCPNTVMQGNMNRRRIAAPRGGARGRNLKSLFRLSDEGGPRCVVDTGNRDVYAAYLHPVYMAHREGGVEESKRDHAAACFPRLLLSQPHFFPSPPIFHHQPREPCTDVGASIAHTRRCLIMSDSYGTPERQVVCQLL
jgi:hypothetical protein